jgi:hypothetical protein
MGCEAGLGRAGVVRKLPVRGKPYAYRNYNMRFPAKTMPKWGAGFPVARFPHSGGLAHATALAGFGSLNRCLDKIVLNHRRDETLLDSIMRAVENNGRVTLPDTRLHRNRWKVAVGIAAGLAAIGALAAAILR